MIVLMSLISILVIAIILVVLVSKRGLPFKPRGIFSKITKGILIVYYLALIFSLIGIYLINDTNLVTYADGNQRDKVILQQTENYFSDLVKNNKLDKTIDIHKNGSWSFKFKGDLVHVTAPENICIVVQELDKMDNKIEMANYEEKYIVESVDFTDKVKPPVINLSGNLLNIEEPSKYQITISKFYQDFMMSQFTGNKQNMFNQGFSGSSGNGILLIKLPKNIRLEVDNIKMNVQYISHP